MNFGVLEINCSWNHFDNDLHKVVFTSWTGLPNDAENKNQNHFLYGEVLWKQTRFAGNPEFPRDAIKTRTAKCDIEACYTWSISLISRFSWEEKKMEWPNGRYKSLAGENYGVERGNMRQSHYLTFFPDNVVISHKNWVSQIKKSFIL